MMTCIVALAGQGKRMNSAVKKQFLSYLDKPLYIYTLEAVERAASVSEIILVTAKEDMETVKQAIEEFNITKVTHIVQGGKERQDSIYNAIQVVNPKSHYIAVQDGVRPLVKPRYFDEGLKKLEANNCIDAVVVAVKAKDTIKIINSEGQVISTPNRETVIHAQTPQIIKSSVIKAIYQQAKAENFTGTDDVSLAEHYKYNVVMLDGDYENIKITTPSDLTLLKKFIEVSDES